MAAFLGFGIGFFLHKESNRLFFWFPRLVSYLVIIIAGAKYLNITHVIFIDPRQYFLLGEGFNDHAAQSMPNILQSIKAIIVMVSLFFLTMATFAALTCKIGEMLDREKPLTGYSINVLGSLLGIIVFSLVSYLEWQPVMWLILAFIPLLYFYRSRFKLAATYFLTVVALALILAQLDPATWSPYYRISSFSTKDNFATMVTVNYDGFQAIQDSSQAHLNQYPKSTQMSLNRHYNIPYSLSMNSVKSVLILGGGTGNDAAAALRNGASSVDVVEIDPVIARLGRELHPEKPYSSDKVHLYIDDARSFLQKTKQTYDLVIFATLDSHTVFSSLSSLRLDNFIFTKESVVSAKNRLNPGGGIAINFFATKPWLFQRHLATLSDAMGMMPLMYGSPENGEVLLVAGDNFDSNGSLGVTNYVPVKAPFNSLDVEPTSDDWPFLFLEKREIPLHYLLPLLTIFALAFIPLRKLQLNARTINWHLFSMGAAFFLIETKSVTTLALICGSTWMVNSIVIASVLVMILLANFVVGCGTRLNYIHLYIALFASLLINFFFTFSKLNQFDWPIRILIGGALTALPLFFAALIFAKAFASVVSPSISLASNLFGSLVGGLLEYLDMWTGLRWLNLIALILYGISFLFLYARIGLVNRPLLFGTGQNK